MKFLFLLAALVAVAYSQNVVDKGCFAIRGTWTYISQFSVGRIVIGKDCYGANYSVSDECSPNPKKRDYANPNACVNCFVINRWKSEIVTAVGPEFIISDPKDETGQSSTVCQVLALDDNGSPVQAQCTPLRSGVPGAAITLIYRGNSEDADLHNADHKLDEMMGEEGDWLESCVMENYSPKIGRAHV